MNTPSVCRLLDLCRLLKASDPSHRSGGARLEAGARHHVSDCCVAGPSRELNERDGSDMAALDPERGKVVDV